MKWVSAAEIVEFHRRIMLISPGVPGISDADRATAIISRVHNLAHYEGVTDVSELAASYLVAVARGHIFSDDNKRTAFFTTMVFLSRNGILIRDDDNELENLTVIAATGELKAGDLAARLRDLVQH